MLEKNGVFHHIRCRRGDIGRIVLLPGDPFRTDLVAERLEGARLVAHNREHKTWTGTLAGERVSVTSTGMGCPSTAIAVEELIACGATTLIRVGTAGRVSDAAKDPRLCGVITTAAVRDEGTTPQYLPVEYPAVACRHVTAALADAAGAFGYNYAEGVTHSKDAFYAQVMPDTVPGGELWKPRWEAFRRANVMASEMEAAALFVVASIRGVRAGGIMAFDVVEGVDDPVGRMLDVACAAVKLLIEREKQ